MNLSKVISSIKMQLGLYAITLPFKDDTTGQPVPTENIIREVLTTTTIPEYSEFVPWIREGDMNIIDLEMVDKDQNIFLLPRFLTLTPVKYVLDVHMPYHNYRGTFGDIAPAYGINRSVQGVATSQAYMMVAGQMRAEPTFDYLGENKIRLYGYPKCLVTFRVACEHEANGESIPDSCYDSFLELATLDVKEFLYNTLKLYDGIPSAFGQINLKIEDYQSAAQDKKEWMEKYRDTYHVDMTEYIAWM